MEAMADPDLCAETSGLQSRKRSFDELVFPYPAFETFEEFEERLRARLNCTNIAFMKEMGLNEADLFQTKPERDLMKEFNRLHDEMMERLKKEEDREWLSMVEATKDVAISEMNFHVKDMAIISDLKNPDFLRLSPIAPMHPLFQRSGPVSTGVLLQRSGPVSTGVLLKRSGAASSGVLSQKSGEVCTGVGSHTKGAVSTAVNRGHTDNVSENPVLKRVKLECYEPEDEGQENSGGVLRFPPKNENLQYVFVKEPNSEKTRIITHPKGEPLPPGYTIASVLGEQPELPPELAEISIPKLQDFIISRSTALTNASSTTVRREQTSPRTITQPTPACPVPPMPAKAPTKRLNSLSDLMAQEMQKKSRLRYKHRNSNPTKVVSIMNNPGHLQGNTITPFEADAKLELTEGVEIERRNVNINILNSSVQPRSVSGADKTPTSSNGSSSQQTSSSYVVVAPSTSMQKPSLTVIPLGTKDTKATTTTLLGCKLCGEVFPYHDDHKFRIHLFVKHDMELEDDKYFEHSKVTTDHVLRCNKCKVLVLNKYEEHQLRCLPGLTKEAAFEEVPLNALNWLRNVLHLCGLCGKGFGMRNELKSHAHKEHSTLATRMIFDPHFRCAKCLRRFDESCTLGKHCLACPDMRPRKETVLELARSILFCDFCGKNHGGLSDTTSCYLNKAIFRCVLCLATFRDKSHFYRHLHLYHGLQQLPQLQRQPKLLIDCPVCNFGPDKYTVIFPHVVTEHYAPALLTHGIGLRPAKEGPNLQLATSSSSISATSSSVVNPMLGSKKILELRPLAPVVTATNAPPGIIINTNRITPTIRPIGITVLGQPRANSTVPRTQTISSMMITPQTTTRPVNISAKSVRAPLVGQAGLPARTVIMQPNIAPVGSGSPAVRVPMSGLFKQGSSKVASRPTGLVRPQPTSVVVRPVTSSGTDIYTSTSMPAILSAVSLVPAMTPTVATPARMPVPVTVVSSIAPNRTHNAVTVSKPQTNVQAQSPISIVPVRSTPATARSSVISATTRPIQPQPPTPTNTTSTTAGTNSSSISENKSNSITVEVEDGPSNSRVITIGGRSFEYQVIQRKLCDEAEAKRAARAPMIMSTLNPISRTPTPIFSIAHTQSRSGCTTARHPVPRSNTFRMPNLPSSFSVHPVVSSSVAGSNQLKGPESTQPPTTRS